MMRRVVGFADADGVTVFRIAQLEAGAWSWQMVRNVVTLHGTLELDIRWAAK
jgi:hypothetical protein